MKQAFINALIAAAIISNFACSTGSDRTASLPSANGNSSPNSNAEQPGPSGNVAQSTAQNGPELIAETRQADSDGPIVSPGSVHVKKIKYVDEVGNISGSAKIKPMTGKKFAWIVVKFDEKVRGFGSVPIIAVSDKGVEYPLEGFGFSESSPDSSFAAGNVMDLEPIAISLTFLVDAGSKIVRIRGIGDPIDVPPADSGKQRR